MQCGLAFSKAGQCRIALLRKELHHKEKEDRGGGERGPESLRRIVEREARCSRRGHFIFQFFFFIILKQALAVSNNSEDIWDYVHIKGPTYMFIQRPCSPFA